MGGSYFAENKYLPIFMAANVHIVYISADFGHKKSDENGNINLEGQNTEVLDIIVTDIGNHSS